MVLGFGRRSKKGNQDDTFVKASPSLPELSQQGIPWPANLVDLPAVKEGRQQPVTGLSKVSFQSVRGAVPFHKPFRNAAGGVETSTVPDGTIASLYASPGPPSAFFRNSHSYQRSQRRPRVATTFNVMVAGGLGTGKTSLLRLLLDTCDISPGANDDQRAAVKRFVQTSSRSTRALQTACIEICETRFDRVLLTVIDTPGLDFSVGAELGLERAVSGIVKYLDLQYAETMGEEAKVVRQNKGDQHVHLCIYLIDPESVMSAAVRKAKAALPKLSRSQTTISYRRDDLSSVTSGESSESSDEEEEDAANPAKGNDPHRLTMSPAELRVIKRLSARVNVLPVVARSDSLTDEKLAHIKKAVRRDLFEAGIGFGVFGGHEGRVRSKSRASAHEPIHESAVDPTRPDSPTSANGEDEDGDAEPAPPVIQIKRPRFTLTRSRSKRNLQEEDENMFGEAQQLPPTNGDPLLSRHDISAKLPFALVAPELPRRKRTQSARAPKTNGHVSRENGTGSEHLQPDVSLSDNPGEHRFLPEAGPQSPGGVSFSGQSMASGRQELKGKFLRKYRWGTIDVLDPQHCDFAALRMAVLNTHIKALKSNTKDVLYEKYRTEKLLARRATKNISHDDRKRLLEDLGI